MCAASPVGLPVARSAGQGPGVHQPLPLPGQKRGLRVGGDPGHRHLQRQDVPARGRGVPQLHPQVRLRPHGPPAVRHNGSAPTALLLSVTTPGSAKACFRPGVRTLATYGENDAFYDTFSTRRAPVEFCHVVPTVVFCNRLDGKILER